MKKKLLPVLLCTLTLAASAQTTDNRAQTQDATAANKLDRSLRAVQNHYQNYTQTRRATRGAQASLTAADSAAAPKVNYNGTRQSILAPLSLIITTQADRADEMAELLQQAGQHAKRINATTVTARVSAEWVAHLAADARVVRLTSSKRMRPFLNHARAATSVDRVHNGEELKTPFTGKGVIVAVIDQSFEYKHMGFLDKDGKSRVKAIWDRSLDPTTNEAKSSSPIVNVDASSETHEEFDTGSSHATHVTNIAAGTKHSDNPYYGVAHEADLIMIPSTFDQAEVVEDVEYIKKYAENAKQPWVLNMSFGGVIGPHDGSTEYDQHIDAMVCDKGGIAVAAMGNEGDQLLHASSTFQPGETKQVFVQYDKGEDAEEDDLTYIDLWGVDRVTAEQFTVTPILALTRNSNNGRDALPQISKRNANFWKKYLDDEAVMSEIDSNNSRENHYLAVKLNKLLADLGKTYDDVVFGVEITAKNTNTAPATLHGWVDAADPNYAQFWKITTNSKFESIQPDNLYIVGEGAASIPSAIAVGSYTTYVPRKGKDAETLHARSSFSSNGPWLNPNYTKPAVLAPGSQIMSAFNQKAPDFETNSASYTRTFRNQRYYYGLMQGTSMSSPFVAGAVALWLQANPNLSSADVMDILKETSTRTAAMGISRWTATDGYGLINVYEGLKLALKKGLPEGLSRVSGSATPATFHLLPSQWQVLFNNPERTATIEVLSLDGRTLHRQTLAHLSQGQEVNIATDHFTPGVYVLQVTTPGAKVSQKVVRR